MSDIQSDIQSDIVDFRKSKPRKDHSTGDGTKCCMVDCKVSSVACKGLYFVGIPRRGDSEAKDKWRSALIARINRVDAAFNPNKAKICSRHFEDACIKRGMYLSLLSVSVTRGSALNIDPPFYEIELSPWLIIWFSQTVLVTVVSSPKQPTLHFFRALWKMYRTGFWEYAYPLDAFKIHSDTWIHIKAWASKFCFCLPFQCQHHIHATGCKMMQGEFTWYLVAIMLNPLSACAAWEPLFIS